MNKRFIVTVKEMLKQRPSGHNAFEPRINYTEEFFCPHGEEHAKLFIKFFDLSALKCGLDTGEFKTDKEVQAMIAKVPDLLTKIEQIISEVNNLHAQVYPIKPRFSLTHWRRK